MSHIEKIMARLRAVEWSSGPRQASESELEGASLYLRTFADFLRESQPSATPAMPFTDPSKVVGRGELLSPTVAAEAEALVGSSTNALDSVYVKQALQWAALCEASHPATQGREDMFDPLLDLVINRVPTAIRKGYWMVDENSFPLMNWIDRYASSR